jgi:hypothetical protein
MEDIVVPIAGILFIPMCLGVWFWGRAYLLKTERSLHAPPIPADLMVRLERMEQGIETIALEVERISEGQRFTTKLLSERGQPVLAPGKEEAR